MDIPLKSVAITGAATFCLNAMSESKICYWRTCEYAEYESIIAETFKHGPPFA